MIEILSGIRETVNFDAMHGVKVYNNVEVENYPPHWHNSIEIIMPQKNGYRVESDGVSILLDEGDIFILPPRALHTLFAPDTGERLIIQIDYTLISDLIGMDSLLHLLRPCKLIKKDGNGEQCAQLGRYLYDIRDEYFNSRPFKEPCIYSLFISLFVALGRMRMDVTTIFPNVTANKQLEYYEKFMSICNYINDHCTETITADELADQAGFSSFHFGRLFKQFSGVSCYDYILSKRVAYAEKLLIDPHITVTDVAMQSGFNSISTFNRIFKESKMCSPTQYRAFLSRG